MADSGLTFDQHVFKAASIFSTQLFEEVPELQGLAIVPIWQKDQPYVAAGMLAGRNGGLESPVEVTRMSEALSEVMRQCSEKMGQIVTNYDQRMAAIANEFRQKQEELEEIERQIQQADQKLTAKKEALGTAQRAARPHPG